MVISETSNLLILYETKKSLEKGNLCAGVLYFWFQVDLKAHLCAYNCMQSVLTVLRVITTAINNAKILHAIKKLKMHVNDWYNVWIEWLDDLYKENWLCFVVSGRSSSSKQIRFSGYAPLSKESSGPWLTQYICHRLILRISTQNIPR